MLHLTIKRVAVIQREGATDLILIHTDLPSSFTYRDGDDLTLEFKATGGYGPEYLRSIGISEFEIIKG